MRFGGTGGGLPRRHGWCIPTGVAGPEGPGWVFEPTSPDVLVPSPQLEDPLMAWTKPEMEVVSVTMEVTAYAATL